MPTRPALRSQGARSAACRGHGAEAYAHGVLAVGVLGPLAVTVDGARVEVPKGKCVHLLTRLALEAGQTVSADRLIEDLWGSTSQVRRNTLQAKVALLRRAVGPKHLASRDGGYALMVEADAVDALAVVRAASAAARHRDAAEPDRAVELGDSVLTLFRGEPFQGRCSRGRVDARETRDMSGGLPPSERRRHLTEQALAPAPSGAPHGQHRSRLVSTPRPGRPAEWGMSWTGVSRSHSRTLRTDSAHPAESGESVASPQRGLSRRHCRRRPA
jgi:Transcriptional regulatory protein, C terminal